MNAERARLSLLLIAMALAAHAFADGILISWGPQVLEGETEETFDAAKKMPVESTRGEPHGRFVA
jgi:hypothetical protein